MYVDNNLANHPSKSRSTFALTLFPAPITTTLFSPVSELATYFIVPTILKGPSFFPSNLALRDASRKGINKLGAKDL